MEKGNTYDSTPDTLEHIATVRAYLLIACQHLQRRAEHHDASKLRDPEKSLLDAIGPQRNLPAYGSEEDKERRKNIVAFLQLHYQANSHHPEHYPDGIRGMSIFDLIEMFFDWVAAGKRHVGGNIYDSLRVNRDRFDISDQLFSVFQNTAKELGL